MYKCCLVLILLVFLAGCANNHLVKIFGEEIIYDFREVRWGMSQEQVELAEVGNTVVWRTETEVIYRVRINDVPCKLVYTFKDNKLRSAGYITHIPVKNADNLYKNAYVKHGKPSYADNKGSTWARPRTFIYANLYQSYTKLVNMNIRRWDATFTYIDRQFYNDLIELDHSELELCIYEKNY